MTLLSGGVGPQQWTIAIYGDTPIRLSHPTNGATTRAIALKLISRIKIIKVFFI